MEIRAVEPPDGFYTIVTEKQDDPPIEDCWVAYHPELPGLMCDGQTEQEAMQNLAAVLPEWLAGLREDGLHVPRPNEHRGRTDWDHQTAYAPGERNKTKE